MNVYVCWNVQTCVGVHMCICMWRPEADLKYLPAWLSTSSYLEQGFSLGPRAHQVS